MLVLLRALGFSSVAGPDPASYVVQEEDGTSKLTLEEGGGSLLLEEST